MEFAKIPGIDKPVSRLVLGTMIINTGNYEFSAGLLDDCLALGCNTLDTAHVYGGGNSERAIGQWMEERGNREQMVILGKGAHHNQDRRRVTPFDIRADLHDTLARLRTDYVDLYLLHRDDPELPVGPIVETFNELREQGLIRAFGGSNWTHERIEAANEYADAHGLVPFAASSPNFTLAEQVEPPWGAGCISIGGPAGEGAREWYWRTQTPIFAWSSMGRGFFSGRVTREDRSGMDDAGRRAFCHERNFQRLDRAAELAEQKGLSIPQIAMAYIMSQGLNVHPLVGVEDPEEMSANIQAASIPLTDNESAWLDLRSEDPPA